MKFKKWDDFLVHCSGISDIMTNSKKKNDIFINEISETCKDYLIGRYCNEKYNVKSASLNNQYQNIQTYKGTALEKEGLEILKKLDNRNYIKPTVSIKNDYILGICDGISIEDNLVIDIKTSINAKNFFLNRKNNILKKDYWWQMQGYMDLYNVDKAQVCFVLINTPVHLIQQEYSLLFKKYAFNEISQDKYYEELGKYEYIYDYNKIPLTKRVIRYDITRIENFKDLVYPRVIKCREFLNDFEVKFVLNKNIVTLPENYISNIEENNT